MLVTMVIIPLSCAGLQHSSSAYVLAYITLYVRVHALFALCALELFEAVAKHAQSGNLYARVHVHKFFA